LSEKLRLFGTEMLKEDCLVNNQMLTVVLVEESLSNKQELTNFLLLTNPELGLKIYNEDNKPEEKKTIKRYFQKAKAQIKEREIIQFARENIIFKKFKN
jgi:hypothetical protein